MAWDVIVVGGGPAGSTIASLVAKAGHRVALFDKVHHPRYQIGESLLLATWTIFDLLGVRRRIEQADFVRKPGATFFWGNDDSPWSVYFTDLENNQKDSRNVDRAVFDRLLLDRSAELGAEIYEGQRVSRIIERDGRAIGVEVDGRLLHARFVVDASGRGSRLTRRLIDRFRPDDFQGAAIWGYYRDATPLPPPNTGNILYAMFAWGWFWMIPLPGGLTSLGAVINPPEFRATVASAGGKGALFAAAIESCPMIAEKVRNAKQTGPLRSCVDFSQDARTYATPGLLLAGDAACFIDPILSTGVHLAMRGGQLAGLALNTVLAGGHEERAIDAFVRLYRVEYQRLLRISREQYDLNVSREERFWRAHRILDPNERRRDHRRDQLSFIRLIAGLSNRSDQGETAASYQINNLRIYARYGLGRFDDPAFDRVVPYIATGRVRLASGYREGRGHRLTFVRTRLGHTSAGTLEPMRPLDVELCRLCDGRRNVREVLARFERSYSLSDEDRVHVRRSLGYWFDRQVLNVRAGPRQFAGSTSGSGEMAQI